MAGILRSRAEAQGPLGVRDECVHEIRSDQCSPEAHPIPAEWVLTGRNELVSLWKRLGILLIPFAKGSLRHRMNEAPTPAPSENDISANPPDVAELELEPGHPGLGDDAYIRRRRELFALCR